VSEELVAWHDFNISLVTAAAALLGLLFVALSLHVRTLVAPRNAELRSIARSIFLGYVVPFAVGFLELIPQNLSSLGVELIVLLLVSLIPFVAAARTGLRASGIAFDRRVTVLQYIGGFVVYAITFAGAIVVLAGQPSGLFVFGGLAVVSLLWGVFNTYELIFRVQPLER